MSAAPFASARALPLTFLTQWSRFAGGSGAPYWSLLACGLKPEHFTYTNAAVIECEWPSPKSPAPETFPKMIWASNYARLACQTLFTLFFAGRDFAPLCVIDGENIQDWLTRHFLVAFQALAERIHAAGDLEDVCVIGWDSMNEPNPGLLSTDDITQHSKESVLRVGPTPTALQAMRLGMGERVEVDNWRFGPVGPKRDGSVVIDPQGRKAWLGPEDEPDGVSPWGWRRDPQWQLGTCVWALHGVWDPATDTALRRDYFVKPPGASKRRWSGSASKIDFGQDYWLPHFHLYARMVRSVHKDAILFAHSPVFHVPPRITGPEVEGRAVFSTHWYDGLTLITKHWVRSPASCRRSSTDDSRRTGSMRTRWASCAASTLASYSGSRLASLRSASASATSLPRCGKTPLTRSESGGRR